MCEGGPEPFERGRAAGDPESAVDRTEALRERLFGNALGALELYTIYLGERLGLYRSLAESGAATSPQLPGWSPFPTIPDAEPATCTVRTDTAAPYDTCSTCQRKPA